MDQEHLKYPIGRFLKKDKYSEGETQLAINDIAQLALRLQSAVKGLNEEQLNIPYRAGGWTIRQVIHHIADSHMNCIIRFKLTLTEENITIKPYQQALWADLADSKLAIGPSMQIIEGVHIRLTAILKSLTKEDLMKSYVHPEYNEVYRLEQAIAQYAWHSNHHLAHITNLIKTF